MSSSAVQDERLIAREMLVIMKSAAFFKVFTAFIVQFFCFPGAKECGLSIPSKQ